MKIVTNGKLIVLDGPDKVGKHTQSERLAEHLNAPLFEYPNYNLVSGKEIREMLDGKRHFSSYKMQVLHATNKIEDMKRLKEALDHNLIVVCNRYTPAALAYGLLDNCPELLISRLNRVLPTPDVVIILDSQPWKLNPGDHNENAERQEKVRSIFKILSRHKGWVVVDAHNTTLAVSEKILAVLKEHGI